LIEKNIEKKIFLRNSLSCGKFSLTNKIDIKDKLSFFFSLSKENGCFLERMTALRCEVKGQS